MGNKIYKTDFLEDEKVFGILANGGIGVLPTDTIYGVIGGALNKETVERIYKVRERTPSKPFIILISSISDLDNFGIELNKFQSDFLNKVWPGSVSVILPIKDNKFSYLIRGGDTLAFRLPNLPELLNVLKRVGPIVAPSANIEGEPSAVNIEEAENYFKDNIDFYVDMGRRESLPSTIVKLEENTATILREGVTVIDL